ncbi:MAG: thermonuclease family protein [Devosia sp.]
MLVVIGIVALLFNALAPHPLVVGHAEIVDGDTLRIAARRIRLSGLDAPELDQTCGIEPAPWSCGAEAKGFLVSLVAGRDVTCRTEGNDRYGRALANCRVAGADLGQNIVAAGWAVADMAYLADELGARTAGRGIWSGPFLAPAEWRRSHGTSPATLWDTITGWFSR